MATRSAVFFFKFTLKSILEDACWGEGREVLEEPGGREASWEAEVLIPVTDDEDLCWNRATVGREEEERFEN